MGSRFRQELTVVPPVHIAVGRRGLTTTIDWRPGQAEQSPAAHGVSFGIVGDPSRSGPLPTDRYLIAGTRQEFGGGNLTQMTSAGLDGFKELLVATRAREREIRADMGKAKWQSMLTWSGRALAWTTLAPAFSKKVRSQLDNAVAVRRSEVATLQRNLTASRVSVSFNMETEIAGPHRRMLDAFDELASSSRSWAVRSLQQIDRVRARSMSNAVVTRQALALGRRADQLVDTDDAPLAIGIQNGRATAYFYPGFLLVVPNAGSDFALIDLKSLEIDHCSTHFTETESVPSDAQMVRKVWAKSNKNGTRDKRFKDNRELPVMLYGELSLKAAGGLNEALMFSRHDACRSFVAAVQQVQSMLRAGPVRPLDRMPPRLPR